MMKGVLSLFLCLVGGCLSFHPEHPNLTTVRARLADVGCDQHAITVLSNGLWSVDLTRSDIFDLSMLSGCPITTLKLYQTTVHDLAPLQNMPLETLYINRTLVTDLTPLQNLPIRDLAFDPGMILRGIDDVRNMPGLTRINRMPAAEFWRQFHEEKNYRKALSMRNYAEEKKPIPDQTRDELIHSLWMVIGIGAVREP